MPGKLLFTLKCSWTLRDFYVEGGLESYLKHSELIDIITFEQFIARANKGQL